MAQDSALYCGLSVHQLIEACEPTGGDGGRGGGRGGGSGASLPCVLFVLFVVPLRIVSLFFLVTDRAELQVQYDDSRPNV